MSTRLLQTLNFLVDEAENGLVAVNKSKKNTYDVIMLDLDMPIMNGYEACAKIRQGGSMEIAELFKIVQCDNTHRQKQPLVIAYSALINLEVQDKCAECGFDLWIEGPLSADKVRTMVLTQLERDEEQDKVAELVVGEDGQAMDYFR